jgi:hypothetical protein
MCPQEHLSAESSAECMALASGTRIKLPQSAVDTYETTLRRSLVSNHK